VICGWDRRFCNDPYMIATEMPCILFTSIFLTTKKAIPEALPYDIL